MEENDSAKTIDPESLQLMLFSGIPKPPCTYKILPYTEEGDADGASFNFEILLNMYMESVIDATRLATMLATKESILPDPDKLAKEKLDIYSITEAQLKIPDPWFKSIHYNIRVLTYEPNDYNELLKEKACPQHYCKILIQDNPHDIGYFYARNIDKRFHFVLNLNYKTTNKLENITAVFTKPKKPKDPDPNNKELMFLISFVPI